MGLWAGLSACQQTGPSGIVGQQGRNQKANVANDLPNVGARNAAERDQNFQYTFTGLEFDQCQDACMSGACPPRCQQILYMASSRYFGSPNFTSFTPQINFFGNRGMQGNSYMFPANQWAGNNQAFVNGYQNHWNQTFQGNSFYTPHNMQSFCSDPYQFTTEAVNFPSNPCSQMDINYLVPGGHAHTGFSYMVNGDPTRAQQAWQTGQTACKGKCFGINYRTYWGTRDVGKENQVIKADLKNTWDNFKKLPGNAGMRLGNAILNNIMTQAMIPVAQIESQLTAQNFTATQRLNYFNQLTNMYMNAYSIPVYAHGATCDAYYNADADQTGMLNGSETGEFVVLNEEPDAGQYAVIDCVQGDGN
jgi:hypothetical protein